LMIDSDDKARSSTCCHWLRWPPCPSVLLKAGGVDISFNAVGLRNTTLQGVPLVDLDVEEFMRPVNEHVRADFLTARLAGRHMVANGAGVRADTHPANVCRAVRRKSAVPSDALILASG
jgi:NAD(P)-dependent dehydrogenase (short-subunit alcohol dehydrogenase family)